MTKFIKITGFALMGLFPLAFLLVSIGTGNFRYFFYAISASLAAFLTYLILRRMK